MKSEMGRRNQNDIKIQKFFFFIKIENEYVLKTDTY